MNRLLEIWNRFDERTIIDSLPAREGAELQRRLLLERAERIVTIGWIAIPIAFMLFAIDYSRWRAGLLVDSAINVAILMSHFVMLGAGIAALMLRRARDRNAEDMQRTMQILHLTMSYLATMAMGLLGLADRREVFAYGAAIAVVNFLYPLPHRVRLGLTLVALAAAVVIVLSIATPGTMEFSLLLGEILVISTFTGVAGGAIYRQLLRAVRSEQILERLANRDGLTGIANRRHAEESLYKEIVSITRQRPASLLLADLDHFKRVNDTAGHAVGDEVLRGFATLLESCCRSDDLAARWGGEEFIVLCRETDASGAERLAERVRLAFAAIDSPHCERCTASFGVAEVRAGDTIESLLARADAALYAAKREGRNRTVIAT